MYALLTEISLNVRDEDDFVNTMIPLVALSRVESRCFKHVYPAMIMIHLECYMISNIGVQMTGFVLTCGMVYLKVFLWCYLIFGQTYPSVSITVLLVTMVFMSDCAVYSKKCCHNFSHILTCYEPSTRYLAQVKLLYLRISWNMVYDSLFVHNYITYQKY